MTQSLKKVASKNENLKKKYHKQNNNSDGPLTSRRTDGGKEVTYLNYNVIL